jgi:hypothetical protein
MRRLLAFLLLLVAGPSAAADLSGSQPVYFWPMTSALDQYIAEQVSTEAVFSVTVDPKQARAVMTESIDGKFLEGMDELFPLEDPRPKAAKSDQDKENQDSIEGAFSFSRPANSPRGRANGTIFLVDVKTRRVLWSTFLGEIDTQPKKLHTQARDIIERLKKTMGAM